MLLRTDRGWSDERPRLSDKRCNWPNALTWFSGKGLMMTETLVGVSPLEKAAKKTLTPAEVERAAVRELVKAARARGDDLTGPDGLLKTITKTGPRGRARGGDDRAPRLRQARRRGPQPGQLPQRDPGQDGADRRRRPGRRSRSRGTGTARSSRSSSSKRQRRLTDVDAIVLSLYAKGLTTGEISAHFAEVYGASVSKDTVSRITDRVLEDMQAWSSRPLQRVYAAVFIDAIYVKVRDGQVGNQPFYAAIGVDLAGHRDVLGLWAGNGGGESAKFWMSVLTDLKNRGVARRVLHRLRRAEGPARLRRTRCSRRRSCRPASST